MFRLENVAKRYRHKKGEVVALEPTTLDIAAGEFVAIVGPSGSGKTTLLSMLGGMLAPTTGKVWLDGRSLYDATAGERAEIRQRRIGFVFQTFNLIPYLSALENVQDSADARRLERSRTACAARELLLARVGLADRLAPQAERTEHRPAAARRPRRTLANDPAVILADEPTGNLDPATREQVLDFFDELCREGRTVIMVTHDPLAAPAPPARSNWPTAP